MISALVLADDPSFAQPASADAVVRTLAALIPATIEGLIRDVSVAGLEARTDLHKIADHAGCDLILSPDHAGLLPAALKAARCDLVFILNAGFAPNAGYIEEIGDRFQSARAPSALLMRQEGTSFFTRLLPQYSPVQGVVTKRGALSAPRDFAQVRRMTRGGLTARVQLRRVD